MFSPRSPHVTDGIVFLMIHSEFPQRMLCWSRTDSADVSHWYSPEATVPGTTSWGLVSRTNYLDFLSDSLVPISHSPAPELPSGSDVRARANATADGPPKPRPRGTGKLLSTIDDIGLAVLRLEQLAAVEKGESSFYVKAPDSEAEWTVRPWRPDWWPELRSATE